MEQLLIMVMSCKTSILRKVNHQKKVLRLRTKELIKRASKNHAIRKLELLELIFSKK